MSWTPHVAHNFQSGEYVQAHPEFVNDFQCAHLAGLDGQEWGCHGDCTYKPVSTYLVFLE